jgi:CHAT domain-containing protein
MKKTRIFLFSFFILPISIYASDIELANRAFEQGKFEDSVQHWQILLAQAKKGTTQQIEIQLKLATSYHALGFYDKARHILTETLPVAWRLKDKTQLIQIEMALSDVYLALQQKNKAQIFLEQATFMVQRFRKPQLLAQIFNKQGNLLMMSTEIKEAMSMYQKSLKLAKKYGDNLLTAKVMLNRALAIPVRSDIDDTSQAINELENTLNVIQALPASHFKSFGLLALSQIPAYLKEEAFEFDEFKNKKVQNIVSYTLKDVQKNARQSGDHRALSYALGFLGQLYQQKERYHEAISLTRQALFYAQKTGGVTPLPRIQQTSCITQPISSPMPEITYRWYWQLARLFKAKKKRDEAIKQYELAINHLGLVRSQLRNTGYRYKPYKFEEKFAPLYLEFIELLFERVKAGQNPQTNLQTAKNAIELLKEEEIKDFLQLDCIEKPEPPINQLSPNPKTAVFYPLFIKQELKLLLSTYQRLYLIDAPILVSNKTIKSQAKDFRGNIVGSNRDDKDNVQNLMAESVQLYRLLIEPIEAELSKHEIETLIIVPDGVLRTIPFAALHDGKQFLLEKYTLVIAQGMDLINTQKPNWEPSEILLNGVSKGVQDFEPLPNVETELKNIQAVYPHSHSTFLDGSFTKSTLETQLHNNAYNIVHIASHAEFEEKPDKTFLLTHDDKVRLNELEHFIESRKADLPLELIALSACETAKGGDKAALGLAGITIKAGAKSALASLWQVNDEATADLIAEFYRQLSQGKTKAQALRQAQLKVMQKYRHPYYWAAFILIGNWL